MKKGHARLAAAGGVVLMLLPWVVAQASSGQGQTEKVSTATMSLPHRRMLRRGKSSSVADARHVQRVTRPRETSSGTRRLHRRHGQAGPAEVRQGPGHRRPARDRRQRRPEGQCQGGRQPLQGPVLDILGAAARRNKCYVIVPLFWPRTPSKTKVYNACALLDRQGKVAGIYKQGVRRRSGDDDSGGRRPAGQGLPGLRVRLREAGHADLLRHVLRRRLGGARPQGRGARRSGPRSRRRSSARSAAPTSTITTCSRARGGTTSRWWIRPARSSPQTTTPSSVLVEQIDLSYALVDWQAKLGNGQGLHRQVRQGESASATARPRTAASSGPTTRKFP